MPIMQKRLNYRPRIMEDREGLEVIDLSRLRGNQSTFQKIMGDVSKKSAAQQVVIGGATGWVTGYVSVKVGKTAAIGLGCTFLLIRLAQHQGYININWRRVNQHMDEARRTLEREAVRQYPQMMDKAKKFVQENMFLATSFAGGFFIGLAF
ncbi:FUN14 domain-containing protein 1-like isoform X2 [Dreissena polymorpha]|uniref:FUN14 domain-containing protein 1-like isoform X2 n=1 Tax=Dreissena polymorpha TaxID=45954 RepID=UPI002264E9A7|nr:FUN14 domain-containing protein 1-like isoform X2 [Dreissena polymorpha]